MRRGEGDGLGEKEASRQKGAEGAVKDGGRWENKKKGAPKAPQTKNRRRRRRKNERIGAEGADGVGRGGE